MARKKKKSTAKQHKKPGILEILVIPNDVKNTILEAVNQTKKDMSHLLFIEWGFGDVLEKGKGAIILLYGPPGCGKTMCAEGIAEMLGKKFMMLGSGDFQSSIPGQTERNIKDAFKKATTNDAVILLDEADGVVYDRSQVGAILSAEINALLSEIERFNGVCILTTNRSEYLDPALERRVCLKLYFGPPDKTSRRKIWRNLIPKQAPLHKDVCFDKLSKYELTGGQIKNAILTAARKAASLNIKKKEIRYGHFTEGVRLELEGKSAWADRDVYRFKEGAGMRVDKGAAIGRRRSSRREEENAS